MNEYTLREQTIKYATEEDVSVLSVLENLSRSYNLDERSVEFASLVRIFNRSIETARENGKNDSERKA